MHELRQMKGCGEEPNQSLRHKLLEIYAQQGNLESECPSGGEGREGGK